MVGRNLVDPANSRVLPLNARKFDISVLFPPEALAMSNRYPVPPTDRILSRPIVV
jgi:hypothetical protein